MINNSDGHSLAISKLNKFQIQLTDPILRVEKKKKKTKIKNYKFCP